MSPKEPSIGLKAFNRVRGSPPEVLCNGQNKHIKPNNSSTEKTYKNPKNAHKNRQKTSKILTPHIHIVVSTGTNFTISTCLLSLF